MNENDLATEVFVFSGTKPDAIPPGRTPQGISNVDSVKVWFWCIDQLGCGAAEKSLMKYSRHPGR